MVALRRFVAQHGRELHGDHGLEQHVVATEVRMGRLSEVGEQVKEQVEHHLQLLIGVRSVRSADAEQVRDTAGGDGAHLQTGKKAAKKPTKGRFQLRDPFSFSLSFLFTLALLFACLFPDL